MTTSASRRRITPAGLLAFIALVVALGGTATAARTLIQSRDIAPGAVKARHIAPNAVTLPKIAPAARRALRGRTGPAGRPGQPGAVGPTGATGAAGPAGATGPAGGFDPSKLHRVEGADVTVAPGQLGNATATCPAGQRVTGGGFLSVGYDQTVFASAPSIDGTTWVVMLDNANAQYTDLTGRAFALCVSP